MFWIGCLFFGDSRSRVVGPFEHREGFSVQKVERRFLRLRGNAA